MMQSTYYSAKKASKQQKAAEAARQKSMKKLTAKESLADLGQRVIEAACKLRDHNFEEDCSLLLEELDFMIDAYRAKLRR